MTKRLLTAEDLLTLKFVGDPRVSPNKDKVAYVLTKMDEEKDGYYSSIYLTDLEGKNQRLTYHDHGNQLIKDVSPRWSPDGSKLTFLSNRTGKNQIWMIPIQNGNGAYPLTEVNGDVKEYVWSPDGKKLALTVEEDLDTNEDKSDVEVITRLRYKSDGTRAFLSKRKHIYIYNLGNKDCRKVTEGDFDYYDPCFSSDGQKLLYLGSIDDDQELEYIPSIWEYNFSNNTNALFYQGNGLIRSLCYSPDGKWVGFIGHDQGECDQGEVNSNVWVVSTETKEAFNISKDLDRMIQNRVRADAKYDTGELRIIWDETSSHVYFTAINRGSIHLYRTNLKGDVSKPLTESEHTITSFDMINERQAVFVQAHAHSPGDIVIQNLQSIDDKRRLTHWNDKLFSDIKLSTPEQIQYKSVDDLEIQGWIMQPVEIQEGQKYPLILYIHGGPQSAFGYAFQHDFQLMASKGYSVLFINPRGSLGYGQDFVDKVIGDWAGKDYEDQMNGIDYVLEKYPFIDKNQMFVTGASYGGYMTNMITTRTERFKAAVTESSVTNLYSMFGTSDIGFYFNSRQLGGVDMWDDEETIMSFSPIRYAKNVKTPTLILHNEKDYRCPMEQGEQWYMALRRLGITTKLVRFPDEDHGLASKGKPSHRLERLEHLIGWFDNYKVKHNESN